MSGSFGTFACPHCAADNRVGELFCVRCGRRLPRSPEELLDETIRRLATQRETRRRLHLAVSIAIGVAMAVGVRIVADQVPTDIVGMTTLVDLARVFWWLAGIIWGIIFWLALSSGRD